MLSLRFLLNGVFVEWQLLGNYVMADTNIALSVKGLCKDFDGVEVLRDIDIDIPTGTTTCILGPSGSGKSTFLRCLNWIEKPSSGSILIHGKPIGKSGHGEETKHMSQGELALARTEISMVFQNFALWPHMTVLGNVVEAPIHVLGCSKSEAEKEGRSILSRVGLDHKMDVYPHTLSGGQKQRVAISRALAMKPKVILFDEPTSSLDPEMVGEVLNVIGELSKEGMTMLVVTHEMAFARNVADTIVFMEDGLIREIATPEEFFDSPKSERVKAFISQE